MNCKNCNAEFNSNFCPDCGQKADIHRVTVSYVLHDFIHSVTHADKGFLLLARQLLTRPGIIAKQYLDGRRKRYFNPLSFLVITSALFAYVASYTGYLDALTGIDGQGRNPHTMGAYWSEVYHIASHAGKWLTLLFIAPLWTAISWVFFPAKKYNYAELFVLHSFIFGESALFRMLLFIPLFLIFPDRVSAFHWVLYEPVFLVYVVVAYNQFFKQHLAFVMLKAIVIRVLFVVLFWFLIYGYVLVRHLPEF